MLSYAEQRALEIGITIAGGADVIMLDEPTAGMSRSETEHAVALIRRVTEGKTLVIVEHDMGVVFDLADRISVLVYGEVIATDTPAADPRATPQCRRPTWAPPSRRPAMLEVHGLHAYYGKSHILHGVDFRVGEGEIVSLLGRNGVGRSTTIKAIMGDVVRRGLGALQGRELIGLKTHQIAHAGLGYVPENRDIFPQLTVRENLMLGMKSTRAGRPLVDGRHVRAVSAAARTRRHAAAACCPAASSRC